MQYPPPPEKKHSFWTSATGIVTAVGGFLAGIAALITAFVAIGANKGDDGGGGGGDSTSRPAVITEANLATIGLRYTGDDGCLFGVQLQLANRTFNPADEDPRLKNVPEGMQDYEVNGMVYCPGLPDCEASGSGTINVVDGEVYNVAFRRNPTQTCTVSLIE